MTSLICGSLAYDSILSFNGRFAEVITTDNEGRMNAAFLVPSMRKEFGGCAGNIAYNLKLLGGEPVIMATLGKDGTSYLERLHQLDLSTHHIKTIEDAYTAQAFITTDGRLDQITAFHPGAMMMSHINSVKNVPQPQFAIVAPDGRDGMLMHAQECADIDIPFIFDPGQGLPMFDGDELLRFIDLASYATFNEYEAKSLIQKTGKSLDALAERLDALIVTCAEEGADIYHKTGVIHIPPALAHQVVDPTGCGDAFRAGLISGLTHEMDWETTGRLANLMGSLKIACQGGQNHTPSLHDIEDAFKKTYGYNISL